MRLCAVGKRLLRRTLSLLSWNNPRGGWSSLLRLVPARRVPQEAWPESLRFIAVSGFGNTEGLQRVVREPSSEAKADIEAILVE